MTQPDIRERLKTLRAPLPFAQISWRVGQRTEDRVQGQALPYIDAREIQNRLDDVVGAADWQVHFHEVIVNGVIISVRCVLAIKVDGEWVEKEDAAQVDDNKATNREFAIKGAYTDAEKRAAVQWGIGRYLYAFRAPWVKLDDAGQLAEVPRLPAEMLPADERHLAATASTTADKVTATSVASKAPATAASSSATTTATVAASPAAQVLQPTEPAAETTARAEAVVDAAAQRTVAQQSVAASAPTPDAAPAQQAAAETADAGEGNPDEMPASLTPEQKATVEDLLSKLPKVSLATIKTYVNGPKGKEKLGDAGVAFLRRRIAAKEQQPA